MAERLHGGSHFTTYRGIRLADGAAVIIKTTKAGAGAHSDARLEREYEITRSLDDPGSCAPRHWNTAATGTR